MRGFGIETIGIIAIALIIYFLAVYPLLSPFINAFTTGDPLLGILVCLFPLVFLAGIGQGIMAGWAH